MKLKELPIFLGWLVVIGLSNEPAFAFGLKDLLGDKTKKVEQIPAAKDVEATTADFGTTPPKIKKILQEQYGDSPSSLSGLAGKYKAASSDFDARWERYQQRSAVVSPIVAEARQLASEGKTAEALDKLNGVILAHSPDSDGQLVPDRKLVEADDAELPAVLASIEIATKAKDPIQVFRGIQALGARRALADRESEHLWFIAGEIDVFENLASGMLPEDQQWRDKTISEASKAYAQRFTAVGDALVHPEDFGVTKNPYLGSKVKVGDWMMFKAEKKHFAEGKISLSSNHSYEDLYDCKVTNIPDSINPVTGSIHYKESCKSKWVNDVRTLQASLAEPAPGWVNDAWEDFWVLAKVSAVGPQWKATDAQVLDLRFFEKRPNEAY